MSLRAHTFTLALLLAAPAAFAADAGVTVVPVDVSQGYFQADMCTPEGDPKLLNECLCKADVHKGQVQGLPKAVTDVINNQLAQVPEQLASESCSGKPATKPEGDVHINEVTANFEVVYQDADVLSVLVTYTNFGAGAAHPTSGSEGYTFDLKTGKTIDPTALLTADKRTEANKFTQAELMKKYGESLLDETKSRTDPYLMDGACENCTVYYTKDGWNVRFQLYAVAPYVAGEPTIVIPTSIIPEPETLLAAGGKK